MESTLLGKGKFWQKPNLKRQRWDQGEMELFLWGPLWQCRTASRCDGSAKSKNKLHELQSFYWYKILFHLQFPPWETTKNTLIYSYTSFYFETIFHWTYIQNIIFPKSSKMTLKINLKVHTPIKNIHDSGNLCTCSMLHHMIVFTL